MDKTTAYYFRLLLGLGFQDEFDTYLNYFLEKENPLSDITLQLACCGSDLNLVISTLNHYIESDNTDSVDYIVLFCRIFRYVYDQFTLGKRSAQEIVEFVFNIWNDVDLSIDSPWDAILSLWYQESDMSFTGASYQNLADEFFSDISEWLTD